MATEIKIGKLNRKQKGNRRNIYVYLVNLLLVPGNDVCNHSVRDAWTDFFSQPDVAFQLLNGQSLLRVLLVLLL